MKKFWGHLLRWIVPLAFSGIAIALILHQIQLSEFIENFSRVPWVWIAAAVLLFLLSYISRVFCWYILLRKKVTFRDTFFTMGAGYLLNNIFPFRLGEIGRAVLLADPKGPTAIEVLSSVVVERVFDVFLGSIFFLSMLPRVVSGEFNQTLIVMAFVIAAIGMVVLFAAARFQYRINVWLSHWSEKRGFIKNWLAPKLEQFFIGLSVLNSPRLFLLAFGSLGLSWIIAFGENYFIFQNLYPSPPLWWMVLILSAAAFGMALPSIPAGFGLFEGVMVGAFALVGVSPDLAFTHAIIIHAISFIFSNLIGLVGLKLRGEAVISFYNRVIHQSPTATISE